MEICSHIFKSWDDIPDISHLLEVRNNYVEAFEHKIPKTITYVSYTIKDKKVVAFGSATYFEDENYYIDGYDDSCDISHQEKRKLWIEGLVSIEKGCGTIILKELEKWLIEMAHKHNIPHKIINIMSVDQSIGFYEENGYVECHTCPRFAGTGNTRVAKSFDGYDIKSNGIVDYTQLDDETMAWQIASLIALGRRKTLCQFIDIPKDISRKNYEEYVRNHNFKECVTEDMKNNIFDHLDEFNS
jgi:hypothetical protein